MVCFQRVVNMIERKHIVVAHTRDIVKLFFVQHSRAVVIPVCVFRSDIQRRKRRIDRASRDIIRPQRDHVMPDFFFVARLHLRYNAGNRIAVTRPESDVLPDTARKSDMLAILLHIVDHTEQFLFVVFHVIPQKHESIVRNTFFNFLRRHTRVIRLDEHISPQLAGVAVFFQDGKDPLQMAQDKLFFICGAIFF